MITYRVFASNVRDFEKALDAQYDSGPLDTCFSTPLIQVEGQHFQEAIEALEAKYPDHPVYTQCQSIVFHFVDENGQPIKGLPEVEYQDDLT